MAGVVKREERIKYLRKEYVRGRGKAAKPLRPRKLGQLPTSGAPFARALPAQKPPHPGEVVEQSDDRRGSATYPPLQAFPRASAHVRPRAGHARPLQSGL